MKAERSRAKTDVTAARTTQRKAEQTAKELWRVQIGLEKERKARSDELRKAKARASDLKKANQDAADKEAAASAAEAARKELEAAHKESEGCFLCLLPDIVHFTSLCLIMYGNRITD